MPAEGLARRHCVGDPRRSAHIVLEHHKRTVAVADDIQTGDRNPTPRGWRQLRHPRLEELGALDRRPRHATSSDDPALTVDVGDEALERHGALSQAGGERGPLVALDHARNGVHDEGLDIPTIVRSKRDLALAQVVR